MENRVRELTGCSHCPHCPHCKELRSTTPTERELQAVELIALGHGHKQAAYAMGINVKTFDTHLENVKRKFGVNGNGVVVVDAARRLGFLPWPTEVPHAQKAAA